jgi:hypothetical protein
MGGGIRRISGLRDRVDTQNILVEMADRWHFHRRKPLQRVSMTISQFSPMIQTSILATALAAIVLGSTAQAASIIGTIDFSSGPGGGVILQDAGGFATTNIADARGIQSWLLPEVDTRDNSFLSVTEGTSVTMATWIFTPSTPLSPLWSIAGPDNFAFHLATATVEEQGSFLLISGTGTLTSTNFDATSAIWVFSTQGPATDGKFSWSSSITAIPEIGTPALFSATLLGACLLRRRNSIQLSPNNNDHETNISPRDVPDCLDGADFGYPS